MRAIFPTAIALLCAASAAAQGVITAGNARFEFNTSTFIGSADLEPDSGGATDDVLFQRWWWTRVTGIDTREIRLPWPPATQSYVGAVATLTWTQIAGELDLTLTIRLIDGPVAGAATLAEDLTITSTAAIPLTLALFSYADFDVFGSAGDDGVLLSPGLMRFEDTSMSVTRFVQFSVSGAAAHQVTLYPTLRGVLDDTAINNLDNTGLPALSIDATSAFQWNGTINPAETLQRQSIISVNLPALPPCPGDVTGDRVVDESDLGVILQNWRNGPGGDVDGDGETDESDLGILLQNWRVQC